MFNSEPVIIAKGDSMSAHHTIRPLVLTALLLCPALPALAQIQVVTVPYDENRPTLPTPAYSGRPVHLKAVARATSGTAYFRWDADGDGQWDLDARGTTPVNTGNWYAASAAGDLDFVFRFADPAMTTHHAAVVEVSPTPSSSGSSVYASLPVRVFAGVPDPALDAQWAENADPWQRGMMTTVALDEVLWYLHKLLVRGGSGNQIYAYPNVTEQRDRLNLAAIHLQALLIRGYRPAYPPGSYETLGVTPPDTFLTVNDRLWDTSPYAEDAVRLTNYLLANTSTTQPLATADEGDDGLPPIAGTNDGYGWSVYGALYEYAPVAAHALAALAGTGLEGTVAQIGSLTRGRTLEFVVQQMVDFLVGAQYDVNSGTQALGAWGYTPCIDCGASAQYAYGQHFGWAVWALHRAEREMGGAGVIVNDLVKNRLPNMLAANPHVDGGTRYHNAGSYSTWSFFEPVGHFLLAGRWLGWDALAPGDPTGCGYPHVTLTRGQARQLYDSYLAYADARWTQSGPGTLPHTDTVLWSDGDFTSGVRGHSWLPAMLTVTHAFDDPVTTLGAHDFVAEFAIDLLYQQHHAPTDTWYDAYQSSHYTFGVTAPAGASWYAALLLAELMPGPDTAPPLGPATFQVDYAATGNRLQWVVSASSDAVSYRVYRADTTPVPIDAAHRVFSGEATQWWDFAPDPWDGHYRLTVVDAAGLESAPVAPTSVSAAGPGAVPAVVLGEAYPNPSNPSTTIPFALGRDETVTLRVYDAAGRLVARLLDDEFLTAGRHAVVWHGRDGRGGRVASGVYFYRLEAGGDGRTRSLVLVK